MEAAATANVDPRFVDLRDHRDEELLRAVHDGLYVKSFPLDEERESLDYWISALWEDERHAGGTRAHALVAGECLDRSSRRIAGLAFFEFYPDSRCGLLSYLAVDPAFRRHGLGRKLIDKALEILRRDAAEHDGRLEAVFAEIHDPERVTTHDDVMDPSERVSVFAKLGARSVPIPYVQPALKEGGMRARALQLIVLAAEGNGRALPAGVVRTFLVELYRRTEGDPSPDDDEFHTMMKQLAGDVVELKPLHAVVEEPAFTIDRYGVAFEFVTDCGRPQRLEEPGEQFASFERDVLAYAYRGPKRRPFSTRPCHVPEPYRQIELEFGRELRFVSEGRTGTLVADDEARDARRVRVQVRASRTRFRSGITIWHLVLVPRSDREGVALTEYDVIKLAKLWEGGEDLRGPYAGKGPRSALRFVRGDTTWTLAELARDVLGDEITTMPRAGIVQLIVDDADAARWKDVWKVIRAAKKEPPIDTSFRFRGRKQRKLVESIAGVIQALLDFRDIDDAELRDVFAGMDVGEDGLQGIHKGTLVYVAASDRTWDVGKMSYGISPYLLLPHAVLLHNEKVLRNATLTAEKEHRAAERLHEARERLMHVLNRGVRHPGTPVSAPREVRATARCVRAERKTLRDAREGLHKALERDYLPNVFHYPNERRIYDAGEASRGLAALAVDLRQSLSEFDARWESGASMRRTMADDLKAGLLFALAGFALKDYLHPVALLTIFGLGGLLYVLFRFYTWR